MTTPFRPSQIYIEEVVQALPLTQKISAMFSGIPQTVVTHQREIKTTQEMTWAKKGLFLSRFKPDLPIKTFDAMAESSGRPHFSLNLISNCHLECTYCILQSYLANNPMITIFTNVEEILEKFAAQLLSLPPNSVIGTGKIADSLALEPITGFQARLIEFVAQTSHNFLLELKLKVSGFLI